MEFKKWFTENQIYALKDIFGFEKELFPTQKRQIDRPIDSFDIEELIESLSRYPVGQLLPEVKFMNEVHWGRGTGAIRVWTGTKGGLMIERLGYDLKGEPRWITKRRYQINQSGVGSFEETITQEVLDEVKKIHESPLDSPKEGYNTLDHLVSRMANTLKRSANEVLIFEGIRRLNENEYIIRFGLRGHGVQAPQQKRVEENHTHVVYYPKSGYITVKNYNIESTLGQHTWKVVPNHINWCFFPTQNEDEIIKSVANNLHWY